MGQVKLPNLNDIKLSGRISNDPELRYTQSNKSCCKFSFCHNRYYKDAQGNQVDDPHFFDVVCWEGTAEFIANRAQKGRPVLIEGELRQEKWQDKESGQQRSRVTINAHRVHILDWDDDGQQQGGHGGQQRQPQGDYQQQGAPHGNGHGQGNGGYQQRQASPAGNGYGQRGGYQQPRAAQGQQQAAAPPRQPPTQPRQADLPARYVEEEDIPF